MLILIVGEYKTGKTVSAGTFPKPALMLDFDDGHSSIKNVKGKDGKNLISDWDQIKVINFWKDSPTPLTFKTAQDKAGMAGGAPAHTKDALEFMKMYNEIMVKLDSGVLSNVQTLIIDSLTSMFRIWKDGLMAANNIPALRIADYLTLEQILYKQFIPTLKTLAQKIPYIILIDHVMMDKDEISGKIVEFPIGPSQNMGKGMGMAFDEIWYQTAQGGEYSWRTKKFGFFQAGSRLDLPDPIKPATFQELIKYITKGDK